MFVGVVVFVAVMEDLPNLSSCLYVLDAPGQCSYLRRLRAVFARWTVVTRKSDGRLLNFTSGNLSPNAQESLMERVGEGWE